MTTTRRLVALACTVGLPGIVVPAFGQSLSQSEFQARLESAIAAVRTQSDLQARATSADELHNNLILNRENVESLDVRFIDEIASLLDDKEDAVRMRIAAALGAVGPRAAGATSALQAALRRRLEEDRSPRLTGDLVTDLTNTIAGTDSKPAICEAFQKIGSNPEPVLCVNGQYDPP